MTWKPIFRYPMVPLGFVDDKYLTKNSDTKAWLQFLKAIGVMDTAAGYQKEYSC